MATLVNCLQKQVNSITPCIAFDASTGEIVLVILCIQIEWLFYKINVKKLNSLKQCLTATRPTSHK